MNRMLNQLMQEGYSFSDEAISALSPYLTEHINRLGRYHLDLERCPPVLELDLHITISDQFSGMNSSQIAQAPEMIEIQEK